MVEENKATSDCDAIVLPILGALALTILIAGYRLNWAWTGFSGTTESYKTLYDWMQLLFVPVALTGFGFFLNYRERKAAERHADSERQEEERRADNERDIEEKRAKAERDIAEDNQREASLKEYIDKMMELILHEGLLGSDPKREVRETARIQTLTVLNRLDGKRKGFVLQFLYDSGLINKDNAIVDIRGANLQEARPMKLDFQEANLMEVNFAEADLREVLLFDADLSNANFKGAIVTDNQLKQAKSLKGAIMPDGSKYD